MEKQIRRSEYPGQTRLHTKKVDQSLCPLKPSAAAVQLLPGSLIRYCRYDVYVFGLGPCRSRPVRAMKEEYRNISVGRAYALVALARVVDAEAVEAAFSVCFYIRFCCALLVGDSRQLVRVLSSY